MAVVDSDGRLVGREAALSAAGAALDDVLGGSGRLVFVTGEAGIGKSALLAEITRQAARRGARILRGVCWDGAGAPPYWPWTQVLRAIASDGTDVGAAGRLLAGPRQVEAGSAQDAIDARFRLFDAVAGLLVRVAEDAPIVVVLDDLHWADEPSVELLEFVSRQVVAHQVLLVGAFRDAEAGDGLSRISGQVLALAGLLPDGVAMLMTVMAGARPTTERVEAVWLRCGGNPFFVRELTRLVLIRGGWEHAGPDGPPIPDGVRATLAQRLARLTQPCVELLAVAATAGPEIRPDVLAQVCDLAPDVVTDRLDEAIRARVVMPDENVRPSGARIAHDLFREAILAAVPTSRRGELHAAVGRALRDLAGGPSALDCPRWAGPLGSPRTSLPPDHPVLPTPCTTPSSPGRRRRRVWVTRTLPATSRTRCTS